MNQLQNHLGIVNNKYVLDEKIGFGGTASVYKGHLSTNEDSIFAIKIPKAKTPYEPLFEKEATFMKELSHPNIINLIDFGKGTIEKDNLVSEEVSYIVMEYAEKGDLVSLIEEKGNFTENEAKKIFLQLLSAVQTIHQNGFVHRDIKPENFLICKDQIKLTDFGFCEEIMNCSRDKNGTPGYIPPEILERDEIIIPEAIDVFSLGVVAFILVLGEFPFENPSRNDPCYTFISEEKWEKYWNSVNSDFVSKEFKEMFQSMVAEQPEKRPTIEEIKKCDWLKEVL